MVLDLTPYLNTLRTALGELEYEAMALEADAPESADRLVDIHADIARVVRKLDRESWYQAIDRAAHEPFVTKEA